jgi:hypothetical protein
MLGSTAVIIGPEIFTVFLSMGDEEPPDPSPKKLSRVLADFPPSLSLEIEVTDGESE